MGGPQRKYVLIDYLGVTAARRNGGLGAELLRLLREKFRSWDGIIVESEAPEGGQSDGIRQRRMNFYRRNGYTFCGMTACSSACITGCACAPQRKGERGGDHGGPPGAVRQPVSRVGLPAVYSDPRDPDAPLQPKESWAEQRGLPGLEEDEKGREQ
ncbi:MAG: hypothetical protein ACLR1T_09800 [Evtepia gabavorous]